MIANVIPVFEAEKVTPYAFTFGVLQIEDVMIIYFYFEN